MNTSAETLLTTAELAKRWRVSAGTLRNWRSAGIGPRFIRLRTHRGNKSRGSVRYRLKDIIVYENGGKHGSTT